MSALAPFDARTAQHARWKAARQRLGVGLPAVAPVEADAAPLENVESPDDLAMALAVLSKLSPAACFAQSQYDPVARIMARWSAGAVLFRKDVIAAVVTLSGVSLCNMRRTKGRARSIDARRMAIWMMWQGCGVSPCQIAAFFRVQRVIIQRNLFQMAQMRAQKTIPAPFAALVGHLAWGERGAGRVGRWLARVTPCVLPSRIVPLARLVCAAQGVCFAYLRLRSRARPLVHARWCLMWALRIVRGFSLPAIGAALGGFDHSTVFYGVNAFAAHLRTGDLAPELLALATAIRDSAGVRL